MNQLLRPLVFVPLLPSLVAQEPTQEPESKVLRELRAELNAARAELDELRALAEQRPTAIHGSLGMDLTTAYYFRGILQEDAGVITEPSVELGWRLLAGDGALRDVDLTFGTWNSVHSGSTGGSGGIWYESDVYATLSGTFFDRVSLATTYTVYHSPNASFETVQEQILTIGFDDSGLVWDGGLRPSVVFAFELAGEADTGSKRGSYAEFCLEPGVALGSLGDLDLTLTVPVHVGFGLHDYYELPGGGGNETFGYAQIGVVVSSNLPCTPSCFGPWELSLGLHYLALGDSNEVRNSGDADEWIGTIGLRTTF